MGRSSEEVLDEIRELYEEVRKESKSKKKSVPKDEPTVHEKPPSVSEDKKHYRQIAKGVHAIDGPAVTLKEIAYDHGLTPKELRRILRKNGIDRVGGRWEWPAEGKVAKKIMRLARQSKKARRLAREQEE